MADFERVGLDELELLIVVEERVDRFVVVRQIVGIITNWCSMCWVKGKTFVEGWTRLHGGRQFTGVVLVRCPAGAWGDSRWAALLSLNDMQCRSWQRP